MSPLRHLLYTVMCSVFLLDETDEARQNIALQKTAYQSTTYSHIGNKWPANLAVDNKICTDVNCLYCAITDWEYPATGPWWEIDLGEAVMVGKVKVFGMDDSGNFLDGFKMFVSETTPYNNSNSPYVSINNVTLANQGVTDVLFGDSPMRYVALARHSSGNKTQFRMAVCEVQVFMPCDDYHFEPDCASCNCDGAPCNKSSGKCPGGCARGWKGQRCDQVCNQGTFGVNCSGICKCYNNFCDAFYGQCPPGGCVPGYHGDKCNMVCPHMSYGENCTMTCGSCYGNITCNHLTGICKSCAAGFHGDMCNSTCIGGTFGPDCISTCGKCRNNSACDIFTGNCSDGCAPGYQKDQCLNECNAGFYGPGCTVPCAKCMGNAVCNVSTGNCPGDCLAGFKGPRCDEVCPHMSYGENCTMTCGSCYDNITCNHVTGICKSCAAGFHGDMCNSTCTSSTFGSDCKSTCGKCRNNSGCDIFTGNCSDGCAPGYQGDQCLNVTEAAVPKASVHLESVFIGGGAVLVLMALIVGIVLGVRHALRKRRSATEKPAVASDCQDQPVCEEQTHASDHRNNSMYVELEHVSHDEHQYDTVIG